jgi:phosphoglycolate phosphatase
MPRFPVLLLDLDGTLTDPRVGITRCIQHALRGMGRAAPPEGELLWCIGPPLRESFSKLLDTREAAALDRALALYRERFSVKGMYENAVYPGVPEALTCLRGAGIRLFLATSKPRVYAMEIVRHFALEGSFEAIHGSELDGTRTVKSELIAHILRQEGIAAGDALMVGDREHDILGARACGVRGAAVTYGYGSAEELAHARPDWVFHSPDELARALTSHSARCRGSS